MHCSIALKGPKTSRTANEYWSTLATSWIVPICPLEVRHWFLRSSYECFGWLLFLIRSSLDPHWNTVCGYRSLHQLFLLDLLDTLLQFLQQHLLGDLELPCMEMASSFKALESTCWLWTPLTPICPHRIEEVKSFVLRVRILCHEPTHAKSLLWIRLWLRGML